MNITRYPPMQRRTQPRHQSACRPLVQEATDHRVLQVMGKHGQDAFASTRGESWSRNSSSWPPVKEVLGLAQIIKMLQLE